ncbi:MAG: DUF4292 domain-containing protein [Ignavibacteria bacterium]|nr:DUF4292 domain-containing protein [Ignavibacteria bacterium]
MLRRDAILLLALVAAAGCAPTASTRVVTGATTPERVRKSVNENQQRVQSLKGTGNITVETPEIAQSGSFELALRKPDSVLIKFEGPFGIDVGAALLTPKDFHFYSSLQNRLITGSMNNSNLRRIFRIDTDFEELINLLTGGSFFAEDQGAPDALTVEEDQFVLVYERNGRSRRYWIDPSSLLIAKIQHLDSVGKPVFEQRFSNFRSIQGTSLPHQIRFLQFKERRAVSISFSTMMVNAGELHFLLDVPKNAQRVWIQ